jgi:hypothetical protein
VTPRGAIKRRYIITRPVGLSPIRKDLVRSPASDWVAYARTFYVKRPEASHLRKSTRFFLLHIHKGPVLLVMALHPQIFYRLHIKVKIKVKTAFRL